MEEVEHDHITYRKIASDEFDKLRPLFGKDERGLWGEYRELRLEQVQSGKAEIYVAEKDGEFIGEITVKYFSNTLEQETIPEKRAYLEAFRVSREHQRQGIGQKLMRHVLADLGSRGYNEATIGVEDDNEIARYIYAKYGFTEAIDRGHGDKFDPVDYTLYLRKASAPKVNLTKVSTVSELCAKLQEDFGDKLYGAPTDIIGFGARGKEIANALVPLVSKKEICFYDSDKTSDSEFHYLDFKDMLLKSKIMVITDEAYLKLFEDATIFSPETRFYTLF